MNISTRKVLDKSFTALAYSSLAAMAAAVVLFLFPIIYNGIGAVVFKATVEHEKFLAENLDYYLSESEKERIAKADAARIPLYKMMSKYESPLAAKDTADILEAEMRASINSMDSHSDEIFAALELSGAKRAEAIKSVSKKFWAPYLKAISEAAEKSSADGASVALVGVLREQEAKLADFARLEIAKLSKIKKLTLSQKSAIRRNVAEVPSEKISELAEKLESAGLAYASFCGGVSELLGPRDEPAKDRLKLMRQKYGQPRLDTALQVLENSVLRITIRERDKNGAEFLRKVSSREYFKNTPVEKMISYVEKNFDAMLAPHTTVYTGFFFDAPFDSNIFGGIWPMILGTFYLTFGSMIIAAPLGIVAAIYFAEYAKGGSAVNILRMCVGTLAGVPSIVFGLFGLAFLINTIKVSESKSVLAGAITLALLILPTIIRSCEEALKAVPNSYREAAAGLGAGKWKAVCTVILPAALPSMLTGIIISMGRAAGETAPIIFTAATSTGAALAVGEIFSQATPALPWNIYNICSEHEMAERVSHVQYGMVLTLIGIVLLLNGSAIWLRAKLQKKIKS